jgi:AmmeMemoRadiSam system protein A
MLTRDEQRELLQFARQSIRNGLLGEPPLSSSGVSENLLKPSGAFVTVRVDRELRGCIGYVEPTFPLADVVADVAVRAATQDLRFEPLSLAALDSSTITISVLAPPTKISSIDEIQIGVHGLILLKGNHKGLLLPEVASERGWSRGEFLEGVTLKAGLPPGSWKEENAVLFIFTADVFSDENDLA